MVCSFTGIRIQGTVYLFLNNWLAVGILPPEYPNMPEDLPFRRTDYIELVDWTGRIIREDKKGHIEKDIPPILQRLNIEPQHWHYLTIQFESPFKSLVDSAYEMRQACEQPGQQWAQGIRECERLFSS